MCFNSHTLFIEHMRERSGLMLYCFRKDEGILIIGNKIPLNIYQKLGNYYEWEDVGTFKIDKYGIVSLHPQDSEWMKDLSGGWKNSDFLVNIYDEDLHPYFTYNFNGIVLKCYETLETCFILSDKVPMDGLNRIKTNSICFSTDWEDIGTFHIELNKIVYHGNLKEDKVDMKGPLYDADFRKINMPSY